MDQPNEYFQRTMTRKEISDAIYNTSMMTSGPPVRPNELNKQFMPNQVRHPPKKASSKRVSIVEHRDKSELVVARDLEIRNSIPNSEPRRKSGPTRSSLKRGSLFKESAMDYNNMDGNNSTAVFRARDSLSNKAHKKLSLRRQSSTFKSKRKESMGSHKMSITGNYHQANSECGNVESIASIHRDSVAKFAVRDSIRKQSYIRKESVNQQPGKFESRMHSRESARLGSIAVNYGLVKNESDKYEQTTSSINSVPNFKARDSIGAQLSNKDSTSKDTSDSEKKDSSSRTSGDSSDT